MSTEVYLDPEETAKLEPFEWEQPGRVGSGISPFAVPKALLVNGPVLGVVESIEFEYAGGEAPDGTQVLSDGKAPEVVLTFARLTRKITSIHIPGATDAAGIRLIGRRLKDASEQISPKAKRFSFLMIARILERYAELIANPASFVADSSAD